MRRAFVFLLPLALLSGACALVYQIAWTREFRLIFGASTPASAAVVAIFVGGLGLGAHLFGGRLARVANPLNLYARLELGIAASSAATPLLLSAASHVYLALGGSVSLGKLGATGLRLVLSALVLAVPTLLMGGTLPALAQAALHRGGDPQRRRVGLLYGVNTLGAVGGCMAATFVLLELLGTHRTLWAACAVNGLVALLAAALARGEQRASPEAPPDEAPRSDRPQLAAFVCAVAALSGFAFFLMELVFYRLLIPLLGGTVFTFGLVLAVALLGIGTGGALYAALFRRRQPDLGTLAGTSLLEALLLALPYALGDRIAVLALKLRPEELGGIGSFLPGWLVVTGIVVLPAAVLAGLQFPVLIALLGRGRGQVASDVGRAYAWNTLGAIAGAICGGFGLMPLLTAPGCWRLAVGILAVVGAAAVVLDDQVSRWAEARHAAVLAAAVAMLAVATGPTAYWRHSPIGAGRVERRTVDSSYGVVNSIREAKESIVWQADGIESTVGLARRSGYAFLTNGKSDGHCITDAPTQVMGGLLGALLHPAPRTALVVGVGSGSSAGWLGRVPTMDRVDVVELEPAMVEVARRCAAVNEDVLNNPRVHLTLGDAREVLSVSPARYDVVFSEPSNPYRAGVASLYTREYYERVRAHLQEGGIFVQWVQAYEIDERTLRTILATMASVFPFVESWQLKTPDLALVASAAPIAKDADGLRGRIATEPYAQALRATWGVEDLEGVFAHFVARPSYAERVLHEGREPWNTDDRTVVEFAFARTLAGRGWLDLDGMRNEAAAHGDTDPDVTGFLDRDRVALERAEMPLVFEEERPGSLPPDASPDTRERIEFVRARNHGYDEATAREALATWDVRRRERLTILEQDGLVEAGIAAHDPRTEEWIAAVAARSPVEAQALRVKWAESRVRDARRADYKAMPLSAEEMRGEADAVEQVLVAYRTDPWLPRMLTWDVIHAAPSVAERDHRFAPRMVAALSEPFATEMYWERRWSAAGFAEESVDGLAGCRDFLARADREGPEGVSRRALITLCYGRPLQEELALLRDDDDTTWKWWRKWPWLM